MRPPFIKRPRHNALLSRESGVTLALVALAIVSIVAMAALSIDVGTLYEASAEAQRSADAAALAGARSLSLNGLTSDPNNISGQWSNACTAATQMAQAEAAQNLVGGAAPSPPTVTFTASDGSSCTTGSGAFGVNPMVTVKVQQPKVSTFFAHVFGLFNSNWKTTTVGATATAEVFNPSASENYSGGTLIPVQPRCVKPWLIPNADPKRGGYTTPFVAVADGSIQTPGISVPGGLATTPFVVGETFVLQPDCDAPGGPCGPNPPYSAIPSSSAGILQYVPGLVPASSVGVPSCANGDAYQQAIAGCDQTTVYQCGVPWASSANPNQVDLTENPSGGAGDTAVATECLTNLISGAADSIDSSVYPYQIHAGASNPLGVSGAVITSSNSIVTLPIIGPLTPAGATRANVTVVGFLQVFITNIDNNGYVTVIVLNVAGCGIGSINTVGTSPLTGTSPVPVRLITPP